MAEFQGFIGTYTKGESKGIYAFTLDTEKGKITNIELAAELENPTYLAISKDNQHLYSVIKEGDLGGIAAFSLDAESHSLQLQNSQLSTGAPPCYVSVDNQKKLALTANYHKGTITSYSLKEDGSLDQPSSEIEHKGNGPDPRQEKPHTHYSAFTPNGNFVIAVELGNDQIYTYEVHNGVLKEKNRLGVKQGSGPRHIVFHPSLQWAYVMTEFSSEIITLQYDKNNGTFSEIQYISTIPPDFKENNQGSAIHITSDGKFIYVGNRGHNSIASFQVNNATGELTFIEHTSSEGNWPRDFTLDPSENYIVLANQESSNLALFSRKTDGRLSLLQADIQVPDPVCVKFLHD